MEYIHHRVIIIISKFNSTTFWDIKFEILVVLKRLLRNKKMWKVENGKNLRLGWELVILVENIIEYLFNGTTLEHMDMIFFIPSYFYVLMSDMTKMTKNCKHVKTLT